MLKNPTTFELNMESVFIVFYSLNLRQLCDVLLVHRMAIMRDSENHDDNRHGESSISYAFDDALEAALRNKFGGTYVL